VLSPIAPAQRPRQDPINFAGLAPLLFDERRDPDWLHNVAEDPAYRDAALRLARRMLDWRLRHADRTLTGFSISSNGLRHDECGTR